MHLSSWLGGIGAALLDCFEKKNPVHLQRNSILEWVKIFALNIRKVKSMSFHVKIVFDLKFNLSILKYQRKKLNETNYSELKNVEISCIPPFTILL